MIFLLILGAVAYMVIGAMVDVHRGLRKEIDARPEYRGQPVSLVLLKGIAQKLQD